MRGLKVLVVVMGVLLAAGTAALIVAVVIRVERGERAAATSGASAGPLHTALPAGSRILGTELEGDRLAAHVALAGGGEAIYLFNARTGATVAVIEAPANR
ncbi:MAG TPA: DUF6476 family protein [Stellaceae bacterium]|nr:DUF6476 family protein [Stellaceae bacterium]